MTYKSDRISGAETFADFRFEFLERLAERTMQSDTKKERSLQIARMAQTLEREQQRTALRRAEKLIKDFEENEGRRKVQSVATKVGEALSTIKDSLRAVPNAIMTVAEFTGNAAKMGASLLAWTTTRRTQKDRARRENLGSTTNSDFQSMCNMVYHKQCPPLPAGMMTSQQFAKKYRCWLAGRCIHVYPHTQLYTMRNKMFAGIRRACPRGTMQRDLLVGGKPSSVSHGRLPWRFKSKSFAFVSWAIIYPKKHFRHVF